MAEMLARRGTCRRRQVGCILVDSKGRILSTGYNGVARGLTHCTTVACPGAKAKSGESLDMCQAIHAEANALLQCNDIDAIHTAYCTDSPCIHCIKLLMNTSCSRIVFIREYPHGMSKELWLKSCAPVEREWINIDEEELKKRRPTETASIVHAREHVGVNTAGSVAGLQGY